MENQIKLGKNSLFISIMTLITVFVWIGFEVYFAYTRSTVPKIIQELIKPLDPNIDQKILTDIESYFQPPITESELSDILNTPTPTPILELKDEEEATSSQNIP